MFKRGHPLHLVIAFGFPCFVSCIRRAQTATGDGAFLRFLSQGISKQTPSETEGQSAGCAGSYFHLESLHDIHGSGCVALPPWLPKLPLGPWVPLRQPTRRSCSPPLRAPPRDLWRCRTHSTGRQVRSIGVHV